MKKVIFLILIAIFVLAVITFIYKTLGNTEEEKIKRQKEVNEYCSQIKEEELCKQSYPPCRWSNETKECVGLIVLESPEIY